MNPLLNEIHSIINGYNNAKDKERVFTYIEFVKQFGYDNDTNIFISAYKDYVTQWGIVKKDSITLSDEEFVMKKMIDVLKSITLDYSSYEEQDFIAHIDLKDKEQLKGLCALYSRKIREITEFYRKKRNESSLIVQRNSAKGSVKSVQEVIYEKIFDFIFSNRNIVPSYKNIKRDLIVSVENYVDTYSEYFDIPRQKEFTDKSRAEMLSANINDVDYRVYIEIQLVVSEILFSGKVWLEEIPLIANIGADLSAECVGDMLMLKNQLMENTTVNLVDLNEQVALKRRFYEKFLGCDLYYLYVDLQGNVKIDRLCKAQNPTGNLLNCGTADTATVENEQLKLLSQIGLFFKPDKTSILKVNAETYTWDIDRDNLINDTVYVFPDPDKYGDIGNNKNPLYPLIMRCELDYELKNASSGFAEHDPLVLITDQGWYSYYSKQQDDFKVIDNKNYEYSLTSLANSGFLKDYQSDIWGNEFGILTGYTVAKDGDKITITLNPKYNEGGMKYNTFDLKQAEGPILLNGGYFSNPLNPTTPFDFKRRLTLIDTDDDKYSWSGIITNNEGFTHPTDTNFISFGEFGCHEGITYHDHFEKGFEHYNKLPEDNINNETFKDFFSHNLYDNKDVEVIFNDTSFDEIEGGVLFVKLVGQKPKKFNEIFNWDKVKLHDDEKVVDISIVTQTIVIETNQRFLFIPYDYDGESIIDTLGIKELYEVNKEEKYIKSELLYNETDKCFYLLLIEKLDCGSRRFLVPRIYQFNVEKYKMMDILYPYDCICSDIFVDEKIDKIVLFSERMEEKDKISKQFISDFQYVLTSGKSVYDNLSNFEIPYRSDINDISFSYNSKIGLYLISYTVNDLNDTPYVYEHKFKLGDIDTFTETLISKVYSLKGGDDESFKWNNVPNASKVSTIPHNTKSKTLNTIWEEYVGEGNANEGFAQDDVDLSGKDFNSNNKNWKSYVYNWDGFNYSLSKTRKVTGGFEFINGKITSFDNKLKFRYYNLILDGKADDDKKRQLYTHVVNNVEKYDDITINVKRDLLGNLQGDNTIQLVKITPTEKREITGEISLKIRGTDTKPEITVTVIVRDYVNNTLTGGSGDDDDDDDDDDDNKDVFEDEKNNVKLYIHSEVRDYDNINKETTATANLKKAIAVTENQWKVTFNGEGGVAKIGKNDCTLSIDRLRVVPCTEERKGKNMDIPKTISTTGEYIELILNQGTTENNKFNFELNITNSTDNVKTGTVTVTENPKTLKLMDSSLDSLDDYSKMILNGYESNKPDKWENKHFTLGYENSKFDGETLHLHLYGTMYLNTCQYNCWIAYDKNGVPIRFKLDTMKDMNTLFANTNGSGLSWTFTGEDVPNSSPDVDSHMFLPQTTQMRAAFQSSDVSRIRLQNDILIETRHSFTHCTKLFDFSITTSNPKEIKPLSKVISARGMFNSITAPNLERVKNRYKINGLKDDKWSNTDPRYYAEWCNIIENACKDNKTLFETNKKVTDTSTWKKNCWKPALEKLANREETFCYDMDELREANFMFQSNSRVWDSGKTWPDEKNIDDVIVGSKKWYNITDTIYPYSTGQPLVLNEERLLDFKKIEVRTPKLLSGVGMFWNRPLTVEEADIFAESLRDLNEQVELNEDVKTKFWDKLGVNQSTLSYKEAFETYINGHKIYDEALEKYITKELDVKVINDILGKKYPNSTETDRINAFRNYISNYGHSSSPFRQTINGQTIYLYPSISLFFDTKYNGYNSLEAVEVIKKIAEKGWEVSTNIDCSGVTSIRNKTLVADGNKYYIRAYEFSGLSGYVRFSDKEYYNTHSERQDYFIDFCKSVVNPITCKNRDAWLKLCLLWNRASLSSSRVTWRSAVGMQQILGAATKYNKMSDYSAATLYVKDVQNANYSATWYYGTANSFMEKYNLREL